MDFRPGFHVSDTTPDPLVDVSSWEELKELDTSSTVIKDLDRPMDITGHVLSPFYHRNMDYQDCRFHSIAHLVCYSYAIINGQKNIFHWDTKVVKTPKFTTLDCVQQWQSLLYDIYSHLCLTDATFKSALIDTGPRPFTLRCLSPWGHILADPDISSHADVIIDILVNVRVLATTDRLTPCTWLKGPSEFRPGTRLARR